MFGLKTLATLFVAASSILSLASASFDEHEVRSLTTKDFDEAVKSAQSGSFIKFFAPWCGYCKNIAADFTKLSHSYSHETDKILIGEVNCDDNKDLCSRFNVKGYPTLLWFSKGSLVDPVTYNDARVIENFSNFIVQKTGVKPRVASIKVYSKTMDADDFDLTAIHNDKHVLVEFMAPWCGYCKALEPIYEKLALAFRAEDNVVIAKINAAEHLEVASRYNVAGYPTIYMFKAGDKENPILFEGQNNLEELLTFVNGFAGTNRTTKGLLNEVAGRISSMDEIAAKFSSAKDKMKNDLIEQAAKIQETFDSSAKRFSKYYTAVMNKMKTNSEFAATEAKRIQALLTSNSVAVKSLDSFKSRLNVLNVFLGEFEPIKEINKKFEEQFKKLFKPKEPETPENDKPADTKKADTKDSDAKKEEKEDTPEEKEAKKEEPKEGAEESEKRDEL